ncbi:MAG: O-antigen ligase family protein [Armatimonadota bacterium]
MSLSRLLPGVMLPLAVVIGVGLTLIGLIGGFATAVVVSVGAIVTVAAMSSLELGLLALILVGALDGFLKGISPGWHTQLLKDYILGICLLRWAWLSVLGQRRKSAKHPLSLALLLFAAWVTVQLFNDRNTSVLMAIAGYRMWIIWLPVFFLAYDCINSRKQIRRLVVFLLIVLAPLSAYALFQYQFGLEHLTRLGPGFDPFLRQQYAVLGGEGEVRLRPSSTMVSPHSFAGTAVNVLLVGVGAIAYLRHRRSLQLLSICAMPVIAVGLLVTAVRSAFASVLVGGVALMLLVRRPGLAVLLVLTAILAAVALNEITAGVVMDRLRTIITDPEHTYERILVPWETAMKWGSAHPLGAGIATGVGAGRLLEERATPTGFVPHRQPPWAENEYARALIELGVPGFALFVWVLASVVRHVLTSYRALREPRDRWLVAGVFAMVVSVLVRLLVGSALYGWPEAIIFWTFVAVAVRLPQIAEQEAAQTASPLHEGAAQVAQRSR